MRRAQQGTEGVLRLGQQLAGLRRIAVLAQEVAVVGQQRQRGVMGAAVHLLVLFQQDGHGRGEVLPGDARPALAQQQIVPRHQGLRMLGAEYLQMHPHAELLAGQRLLVAAHQPQVAGAGVAGGEGVGVPGAQHLFAFA